MQVSADAEATVFRFPGNPGIPAYANTSFSAFQARAGAWVGAELGAEAGVSLINAQVSLFDLNLGVALDTEVGIKDDSLVIEALGCGFKIGRKVSISVFGSSFGIDFGRLFS